MNAIKILTIIIGSILLIQSCILIEVFKRLSVLEDKVNDYNKIIRNEYEASKRMEQITKYYQIMIGQDDKK